MLQQSTNWHEWRAKGIGGSDAPIIMGTSPWKTAYELWEEKVGLRAKDGVSNWAQSRGNDLEPIIRARYELETGFEMGPATCQHHQVAWLRASMDGFNPMCPPFGSIQRTHKRGLEIKTAGREDHEGVKLSKKVPDKYYPQLQHQFIVTGAEAIDYYSYYCPKGTPDADGDGYRLEVLPDMKFIAEYLEKAKAFWKCVETKTPPPLSTDDYKIVRTLKERELANVYARIKKEHEAKTTELEEAKAALLSALNVSAKDPRFQLFGTPVQVVWISKVGNVDYSKIPQLQGVDLDQFRKKNTEYAQINIMKSKLDEHGKEA